MLEKSERYLAAIQQLSAIWELPRCTLQHVEAYICVLYGNTKYRSVNELRAYILDKRCTQKNKVIDLFLLPPCESALMLHCKRANYVVKVWKSAVNPIVSTPEISKNGLTVTCDIE